MYYGSINKGYLLPGDVSFSSTRLITILSLFVYDTTVFIYSHAYIYIYIYICVCVLNNSLCIYKSRCLLNVFLVRFLPP